MKAPVYPGFFITRSKIRKSTKYLTTNMAIITNTSPGSFLFTDINMWRYELAPGQSVTIDNTLLNPFLIADAEEKGIISLSGWAPSYANIDDLNLPQEFYYNPDGTISYIIMTSGDKSWKQTFTYTNGQLTMVSPWIQQ